MSETFDRRFAAGFLGWHRIGSLSSNDSDNPLYKVIRTHQAGINKALANASKFIGIIHMKDKANLAPVFGAPDTWIGIVGREALVKAQDPHLLIVREQLRQADEALWRGLGAVASNHEPGSFDRFYMPSRSQPLGELWYPTKL